MAEADLLSIIGVVAMDAEALGFPETAKALRKIIDERGVLQDSRTYHLCNTYKTRDSNTLLN